MSDKSALARIDLKILVCDRSRYINNLWSQFGLSVLIDCYWDNGEKKRILFDSGWESDPLLHNMGKLNISVESIDSLVLSHCHYDHTGGLKKLINDETAKFKLFAHKEVTRPVYSLKPEIHYIGIDEKLILQLPRERLILLVNETEIYPEIHMTGTVPRITDFEKPEEDVYILDNGILIEDPEKDDMALVFDLGESGIVVVTGCSHAGIANTLYHSINITNNKNILGVVGGFHLIDLSPEVRRRTIEELEKFDIANIWSGHCTGFEAEYMLRERFGTRHGMFYTGDVIKFTAKKNE
ncbi:MAG: MBL fold metallo-hydrolase [Candidatus Atribacteria bacterium]|nr:MBL fold metallo-hydrolase [Candidatus Atribacteria bacterium]